MTLATAAHTFRTARAPRRLEGRDIVCFSHDWSGDPLSKTHLMRLLSRHNRILWVNSIGCRTPSVNKRDLGRAFNKLLAAASPVREPEPNIFVLNPLALPLYGPVGRPFNRWLLARQVRRAMTTLGFHHPINWIFNPAAGMMAHQLDEDLVIYYCVDEYTAQRGVNSNRLAETEQHLLHRADIVFVSAERLYRSKSAFNTRTVLIRHGVDYQHFRRALDPDLPIAPELAGLPRPIIGYFGLISQDWVDLDLIVHVARHFPGGSIVMLGKVAMDVTPLQSLPNVHVLGRKPYSDLPSYCRGFDVAIIPFPASELTLNANPLKAREYLAAGLPVVSTAIPEVSVLRQCHIGKNPGAFVRELELALAHPGPSRARSETMQSESWEARLAQIESQLLPLLDAR